LFGLRGGGRRGVVQRGDPRCVGDRSGGRVRVGAIEDDAGDFRVVAGVLAIFVAVEGGHAAEEELADVGDGHGVAALDAFAGELADEVAEKRVDGVGCGEIGHVAEEFGGGGVVATLFTLLFLASVMGAQFQIGNGGEEAAVLVAAVDVAARSESLYIFYTGGLGLGGWRDPSPCGFDARM
jgi:hypothetical protein